MYNKRMNLFTDIQKPTLLLNEAVVRANIERMTAKARAAGIAFRPHFKTHQSAEIGEWFRAAGVQAITVSSVDMALYFADHGWRDITIAFSANPRQAETIAQLAEKIHLGLLFENIESVQQISAKLRAPIDAWIKIDVGAHRTGIPATETEQARRVAVAIQNTPLLRLKGLLTHAGHTYTARGAAQVCQLYAQSIERISTARRALQTGGITPLLISVGDTPASSLCADLGAIDELRPGNFVFYDATQAHIGSCTPAQIGVALACPVVALHPERSEAVIYGGAVHLSKDFFMEDDHRAYGWVTLPQETDWGAPLPGAYVASLSQEHGILHLPEADLARLRIGDLVCILPAHSCLTVTLMKRYLTLGGRWMDTLNV